MNYTTYLITQEDERLRSFQNTQQYYIKLPEYHIAQGNINYIQGNPLFPHVLEGQVVKLYYSDASDSIVLLGEYKITESYISTYDTTSVVGMVIMDTKPIKKLYPSFTIALNTADLIVFEDCLVITYFGEGINLSNIINNLTKPQVGDLLTAYSIYQEDLTFYKSLFALDIPFYYTLPGVITDNYYWYHNTRYTYYATDPIENSVPIHKGQPIITSDTLVLHDYLLPGYQRYILHTNDTSNNPVDITTQTLILPEPSRYFKEQPSMAIELPVVLGTETTKVFGTLVRDAQYIFPALQLQFTATNYTNIYSILELVVISPKTNSTALFERDDKVLAKRIISCTANMCTLPEITVQPTQEYTGYLKRIIYLLDFDTTEAYTAGNLTIDIQAVGEVKPYYIYNALSNRGVIWGQYIMEETATLLITDAVGFTQRIKL